LLLRLRDAKEETCLKFKASQERLQHYFLD